MDPGSSGWILSTLKLIPNLLGWLFKKVHPASFKLSRASTGWPPHLTEGAQNGKPVCFLAAEVLVTNITTGLVTISSTRGILLFPRFYRPLARSAPALALCSDVGDTGNAFLSGQIGAGQIIHLHANMTFAFSPPNRRRLWAKVAVRDQGDRSHRTKWFRVEVENSRANLLLRIQRETEDAARRQDTERRARKLGRRGHPLPMIEILVSALRAEVEAYRRNGRSGGGLGSITFTCEGRKFNGVPSEGYTPGISEQHLVTAHPEATQIQSERGEEIVSACSEYYQGDLTKVSQLLIEFISDTSEFSTVAYFLVYCGYRLGVLSEVFKGALARLRNAKDVRLSEVFRLMNGVVRFAYPTLSDAELRVLEEACAPLPDVQSFRLPIYIADARVRLRRVRGAQGDPIRRVTE